MFDEAVHRRRLAGPLRLDGDGHARVIGGDVTRELDRAIDAAARDDDDLVDRTAVELLIEERAQRRDDVALLVVRHHADRAADHDALA